MFCRGMDSGDCLPNLTGNSPARSHLGWPSTPWLLFLEVWVSEGGFDSLNGATAKAVTGCAVLVQASLSSWSMAFE